MANNESVTLRMERVNLATNSAPKILHRIIWTRVGADIQLDMGYFDLSELRTALESGKTSGEPPPVELKITNSFIVSPSSAWEIFTELQRLVSDLEAEKLVPPADTGTQT